MPSPPREPAGEDVDRQCLLLLGSSCQDKGGVETSCKAKCALIEVPQQTLEIQMGRDLPAKDSGKMP